MRDSRRDGLRHGLRIGLLAALPLVAGCTETYGVAGLFEASSEPFFGTVSVGMGQAGSLEVVGQNGQLQCTGASKVTQLPSGYSRDGAQGSATAICNDGRTFKVDFIQTTTTGGRGLGVDDRGNVVRIYFDQSDELARTLLDQHRLNASVQ